MNPSVRIRHLNRTRFLSIMIATLAFSQVANGRPLQPEDIYRVRDVSDVHLSPDGQWVAYTVSTNDKERDETTSDLWMNRLSDGKAMQLTHTATSESAPRWSPDGHLLGFLSAAGGEDDLVQIWTLDWRDGATQQLSNSAFSVIEFDWSPDGRSIVFTADVRPDEPQDNSLQPVVIDRFFYKQDQNGYLGGERTHLFLLDVDSGSIQQLTDGDFYEQQPSWSPDGKHIAFISKRGEDFDRHENWDVFVMDARPAAEIRRATNNPGNDGDSDYSWGSGAPAWSPNGEQIAYLHGGDLKDIWYGLIQAGITTPDSRRQELPMAELDRNSWHPRWSADGKSIYFLLEDNLSVQLARVRLRDGRVERLSDRDSAVSEFDLGPADVVAYVASSPTQPSEIWTLANGNPRRLSAQNDTWLAEVDLLPATAFSFDSADGLEIHGLMIRPAANTDLPGPLIMQLHGGPNMQHQFEFDFEWQLYPPAGYVVAGVNFRGSTGRGYAFQKALFADWGHAEVPDVLGAVDYLVEQKIADPEKLGVGGWSYGAILTNYIIASTDRFKAAISGAGMSNMLAGYGTDQYVREWQLELGKPWENPDTWLRLSYPFLHADRISTPTLFMVGANDFNVPLAGSEQMYQALRSLKVPTQLVIYPGQFHTFDRPSFNLDAYQRFLSWYGKYLQPGTQ